MKRFKHKQTGHIATETHSEKNYKVSYPQNYTIPKWIIENSNDWEEVNPIFTTTDGVDLYEIPNQLYCVLAKANWAQETIHYPHQIRNSNDWKYFTTKEARQEYIKKQKPKFSIQNIEDAYMWDKTAPLYTQFIDNLKKILGE
jgi:hypothetical protein